MKYKHPLTMEAEILLDKLDNPACVLIRKLLVRINELEQWNNKYSDENWKLIEEINELKESKKCI